MINTHEQEKKQFKRLFQQQGVDKLTSRSQVLEAFLKLEHHVTIKDILAQLGQDKIKLDEGLVLNSMELLCRFGFASKIEFDDKETQYEHRHLGLHHEHMVCTICESILEFKDEEIERQQFKVANVYGFHMLQHKMEIYGICSKCMEERNTVVSLNKARQGENIEIVSAGFGGQMVIATRENRLVLGAGMAEKIRVQPFDQIKTSSQDRNKESRDILESPLLLSQMKTGQEGIIRKVSGESTLRRRLLEMGINRGSAIYVEKYAPLKDPIELVIKGYHISLRVDEAANIIVENVKFKKR
jgi:Fur family ferric uptake transcriptional regulator